MRTSLALAALVLALGSSVAEAQTPPPAFELALRESDCMDAVHAALAVADEAPAPEPPVAPPPRNESVTEPVAPPPTPPPTPRVTVPRDRTVASLSEDACLGMLRSHDVDFHRLDPAEARGVGIPIRLDGPLAGITVRSRGHSELHEIVDCRLAVALLAWAPELHEAGVVEVHHYSTYRPGARVGGSRRRSGHANALAIDLAVLVMRDGSEREILTAWESRARGAAPCDDDHDEGPESASLRRLVCSVAEDELFQIVLTPHYDAAHANHVHLELRPGVSWQYVH